jgi:glycosyltransferase involved in cell wall biosynthesis
MSDPVVSVITAVYNRAALLPRCIASVAAQDYPRIEHIVVDGGSTDGTVDVIRAHERILGPWVSAPDRGVFDAWNKGLALARGEWIAFLGADDQYRPDAIRRYVETAAANPAAEYISSRVALVYPSGAGRLIGCPWSWHEFRRHMCVAHVGSFHRASLFRRVGGYDIGYRIVGDYELLLRAGDGLRTAFLNAVTARMDAGGQSDSTAALAEARRAKLQHRAKTPIAASVDHVIAFAKHQYRHRVWRPMSI